MGNALEKDQMGESYVDELSPGTELLHGQFTIEKFLNSGGFGITYLARDSLDRQVVIKECFPSTFCHRSRAIVQPRSRAHTQELKSVVDLFVQEARSLAKLDHPNIVGVHQVFEDNQTAYMALDYVEGRDLLDMLEDAHHGLTAPQIKGILKDVLGAVGYIHSQDILHRDISPDNILLDSDLRPVLIDFGAAREEATKKSRVLSALHVVKDGYSPQEFYVQGSAQSPSSDLYALGATFYHLIDGDVPPNSQSRLAAIAAGEKDLYVPLEGRVKGYDSKFLGAIDKALAILPKDRIASAQDWLDMMEGRRRKSRVVTSPLPMSSAAAATQKAEKKKRSALVPLLGSAAVIAIIAVAGLVGTGQIELPGSQTAAVESVETPAETAAVAETEAEAARQAEIAAAEAEAARQAEIAAAEAEAARQAEIAAAEAEAARQAEIAAAEAEAARQAEIAAAEAEAARQAEIAAAEAEAARQAEIAAAEAEAARQAEIAAAEAEAARQAEIAAAEAEAARQAEIAAAEAEAARQAEIAAAEAEAARQAEIAAAEAEAVRQAEIAAAEAEAARQAEIAAAEAEAARQAEIAAAEAEAARQAEIAAAEAEAARQAEIAAAEAEAARQAEIAAAEAEAARQAEIAAAEAEAARQAEIAAAEAEAARQAEIAAAEAEAARQAEIAAAEAEAARQAEIAAAEAEAARQAEIAAAEAEAARQAEIAAAEAEAARQAEIAAAEAEAARQAEIAAAEAEASGVQSIWKVDLPFIPQEGSNVITELPDVAPAWASEGTRIVAVNGTEISALSQIPALIRAAGDPGDAKTLPISFTLQPAGSDQTTQLDWELPVVQETRLADGSRFETRFDGETWQTFVTASPSSNNDLEIGDQLIALMATSELLAERTSLKDIMERGAANGDEEFSFAVSRNGSMWVVLMTIPGGA